MVGRVPGDPNTRCTRDATVTPSTTPATRSLGNAAPRYIADTPRSTTISHPSTRAGRGTYGAAATITATMIATRVDGYADGDPPNPTAIRSEWAMLSWASTISPSARAEPHARTPATTRSRARRRRPATSAATTTRPTAHNAPRRYSERNSGASAPGSVLNR